MPQGTLHLIPVPLGNPRDITLRAVDELKRLSILCCEDTRDTSRLLTSCGIDPSSKKLISFFQKNERGKVAGVLRFLETTDVGVISSRGTPLISDPGYILVREAINAGVSVQAFPGACAATTALLASALPPDKFLFLGFPPRKEGQKRRFFEKFKELGLTLIFYESPLRLIKTLTHIKPLFVGWHVAICRELTKTHEEVIRGTYEEVLAQLKERKILGEITVVMSPKR